jgi:hypothetical protein
MFYTEAPEGTSLATVNSALIPDKNCNYFDDLSGILDTISQLFLA